MGSPSVSEIERSTPETVWVGERVAELLVSRGGMGVVGHTNNGPISVAPARETNPDVVILQVESPLGNAKDTLSELLRILPPQKIVMVTMFAKRRR
jgi:DNA-binding NarL/FixJ family response regulator